MTADVILLKDKTIPNLCILPNLLSKYVKQKSITLLQETDKCKTMKGNLGISQWLIGSDPLDLQWGRRI